MFMLAMNEEGSLLGSEKWKPGLQGLIRDTKPGFKHFWVYLGKKIALLVVYIWRIKIDTENWMHMICQQYGPALVHQKRSENVGESIPALSWYDHL